ncbi:MAG: (Fe-S)-binding protein [Chloroflexi bacterium]|nr:(Fe-S)-binding protein [Chloroflexota bacterium]
MYLLAGATIAVFTYGFYRRYRLWRLGKPANRLDHVMQRVAAFIAYGPGHGRTARDLYPGLMHLLIFSGFVTLFIGTLMIMVQADFDVQFLHGQFYLFYSLFLDVFGFLAIVGVLMALFQRYVVKPEYLYAMYYDGIVLGLLLANLVTGFGVEGLRMAATELRQGVAWAAWSPVGYVVAQPLVALDPGALQALHTGFWWLHLLLALAFIAYMPYSKMLHSFTSPLNTFLRSFEPKGQLSTPDLETAETFGAGRIRDFTWKDLFDGDACTECGRCTAVCPARSTGKLLDPKLIVLDLRNYITRHERGLLAGRDVAAGDPALPALVGEAIPEQMLWDCTTCRACMQACPVLIEHVPKIVNMRRYLVLEESRFPREVQGVFNNLENRFNPWQLPHQQRAAWAEGLDIPTMAETKGQVEYLLWVGCFGAFDDRNKRVTRALAKILKEAGVSFAILGSEEKCTGDPARRIGNEYLYQMLAQENVETLNGYGVRKIVTQCPHCFNTIRNEYPDFGGRYEVIHHTQLLAELIAQGRIKPTKPVDEHITFHDPCYLGRYNDEYDAPRYILKSIPGLRLSEMAASREKSFCCGAGGGRMFMEEKQGARVNQTRVGMAQATGADVIAAACPFCTVMLEDGITGKGLSEQMRLRDCVELLAESLGEAQAGGSGAG